MVDFTSDYIAGAHPLVLQALFQTNTVPVSGYGTDPYCEDARARIREWCGDAGADVFFLTGGTQTNRLSIAALLREYQGVIAADTGHIACHEAGAIESTGHKVITVPGRDGKIDIDGLRGFLRNYDSDESREHMVFPGMVYISHPTEYGTLYTLCELREISQICRERRIPLYMDGARLAYGLSSTRTDVSIRDIHALCDAYYIGGTKVGALCGEALVFPRGTAPEGLFTMIKRHGALQAKGRLLGVQFAALFTDDLYEKIGRQADQLSLKIREAFESRGYSVWIDSPTNQQFVVIDDTRAGVLRQRIGMSFWERIDDERCVYRLAAGWSTSDEDIIRLGNALDM